MVCPTCQQEQGAIDKIRLWAINTIDECRRVESRVFLTVDTTRAAAELRRAAQTVLRVLDEESPIDEENINAAP